MYLSPKQLLFVDEYLIDLNATKAAIRAGYSEKTANEQGARLLANVSVQFAIQKAMKERSVRTGLSADMVVQQLAKIAFADIRDFVTWEEGGKDLRVKAAWEIDGTLVTEITANQTGNGLNFKFKRIDQLKALELLGKHLGMFKDKVDITSDNEKFNIIFNIPRPPKKIKE